MNNLVASEILNGEAEWRLGFISIGGNCLSLGEAEASSLHEVDTFEVFLGAGISVEQGEGCAILVGGGAPVALLLKQLAEQLVSLEGRSFFDCASRKIAAKQAHRERRISIGPQQKAGAIH